jgi:hypothetical protein
LFDGYDKFFFSGFLTKYKGIVVVESLNSMLIACSQVNWMSSLSLRMALKDCGSGRYLSTESSMEEWVDEEAVASMVSMAV